MAEGHQVPSFAGADGGAREVSSGAPQREGPQKDQADALTRQAARTNGLHPPSRPGPTSRTLDRPRRRVRRSRSLWRRRRDLDTSAAVASAPSRFRVELACRRHSNAGRRSRLGRSAGRTCSTPAAVQLPIALFRRSRASPSGRARISTWSCPVDPSSRARTERSVCAAHGHRLDPAGPPADRLELAAQHVHRPVAAAAPAYFAASSSAPGTGSSCLTSADQARCLASVGAARSGVVLPFRLTT